MDGGQSSSVWLKICIAFLSLAGLAWVPKGSEIVPGLAAGVAGVAVLALATSLLEALGVPWKRDL